MTPRASFVIPAYNAQKYLTDAVFSCLKQSIKQIEVIVVDDGSTDGTRELLRWLASEDKRVKPVYLDKNVGRSQARNIGNETATAPLIFVLDADDMCCKNRVQDSIAAFSLRKLDVVYGPFFEINEMGAVLGKVRAGPFNKEINVRQKMNFICHSTMAYRREVAQQISYSTGTESELGIDDWKFQWDAYLAGYRFGQTKAPLSYYRLCEGTVSTQRDPAEVLKVKEAFLAKV